MNFHFNQKNRDIKYFNCANNNTMFKTCPTTHYIRVDFLEQIVLGEIRRLTRFATAHEDEFTKLVMGRSQQALLTQRQTMQKELARLTGRDRELDSLFERIYEDNVVGKISDERFSRMSRSYEAEQGELTERMKTLKSELDKTADKSMTTEMFAETVRKYSRVKKLSERMLNELIERIEVHQSEKIDGVYVQTLTIHFNCVGEIAIPETAALSESVISVHTRKGVDVRYQRDSKIAAQTQMSVQTQWASL
jgi:ATP-dependent Lon protease